MPAKKEPVDYYDSKQFELIVAKLDKITSRLDATVSLLLDLVLSDPKYENPVSYTDKAARLEKLGIELETISGVVRRPSNYVSSRLRESKTRKSSRRQKRKSKEGFVNLNKDNISSEHG